MSLKLICPIAPLNAMRLFLPWLTPATLALILLSVSSCASVKTAQMESQPTSATVPAVPVAAPSASPSPLPDTSPVDPWVQALDRATKAANLAESAQSQDDWQLVSRRWQEAIALLKTVPSSHPRYAQVQPKMAEYERNLTVAQQRYNRPSPTPSVVESLPPSPPQITNAPAPPEVSVPLAEDSPELALANHLANIGATMYGTYWCGYCNRQRALFADGLSRLPQVECDPRGSNARPDLCQRARVAAFPTWEINGQLYPGMRSLDELASLSGYQGSRDFQY